MYSFIHYLGAMAAVDYLCSRDNELGVRSNQLAPWSRLRLMTQLHIVFPWRQQTAVHLCSKHHLLMLFVFTMQQTNCMHADVVWQWNLSERL